MTDTLRVELFVNGTLMRGDVLHQNLDGARFISDARTAPRYRLYSIGDVHPGMIDAPTAGVSVDGEVTSSIWSTSSASSRASHQDWVWPSSSWRAAIGGWESSGSRPTCPRRRSIFPSTAGGVHTARRVPPRQGE